MEQTINIKGSSDVSVIQAGGTKDGQSISTVMVEVGDAGDLNVEISKSEIVITQAGMVTKIQKIRCNGRGPDGNGVLEKPIEVTVGLTKRYGDISVSPKDCPFNTGSHGQRCKASHPDQDKVGEGIFCPFSFDYPYATEFKGWTIPAELKNIMQNLMG